MTRTRNAAATCATCPYSAADEHKFLECRRIRDFIATTADAWCGEHPEFWGEEEAKP